MPLAPLRLAHGFTLIEVLVTFLIVALGLLGLGALQINTMNNSLEAYERGQAIPILEDMAARIRLNPAAAVSGEYFLPKPLSEVCAGMLGAQRDLCEWHKLIDGASATVGEGDAERSVGALIDAQGCIDLLSGSNAGEMWIRVSLAWVGVRAQSETVLSCGAGEMGDEAYRRVLFRDVAVR